MIVSGGQQRESAMHILTSFKLASHPGCHIILSRVSCAIQETGLWWLSILNISCCIVKPHLFIFSGGGAKAGVMEK